MTIRNSKPKPKTEKEIQDFVDAFDKKYKWNDILKVYENKIEQHNKNN